MSKMLHADARVRSFLSNETKVRNIVSNYESSNKNYIDDGTVIYSKKPFTTLEIKSLFADRAYVNSLLNEVRAMEYFRKATDLYCFEQSNDFNNLDLGPSTKMFMEAMYMKLKPLLENVYGFTCNRISITASRYKQKDYLLCHDDKCSDRHIAFIYYLCPDWDESEGGLLCLFSHDKSTKEPTRIIRRVIPQMNHFLVFKVGTTTYHEVSEVTAENKERYTINGWFHSPVALREQATHQLFNPVDPLLAVDNSNEAIKFAECLSPLYNKKTVMKGIHEEYNRQSSVLLPNFLEQHFFNQCINELTDSRLQWKCIGPPNQRRYEVAIFDVDDPWQRLPENTGKLVRCLTAPNFFDYMECLTGERLSGEEVNVDGRTFAIQLQKWSGGCYSLLSDNNVQNGISMLDLNLFLKVDEDLLTTEGQGSVVYSSDHINIIGEPSCNSLFIVNNEENTGRYVKYINALPDKKCYIYVMYMTCMSIKNTVRTSVPDPVEEKWPSSNIVSADKAKQNVSEREFDCNARSTNKKRQCVKTTQKVAANQNIATGNVNCEERKNNSGKNMTFNRNIFVVSENKSKIVNKGQQSAKSNFLSGKRSCNGNTFIVTDTADIPKKKSKQVILNLSHT